MITRGYGGGRVVFELDGWSPGLIDLSVDGGGYVFFQAEGPDLDEGEVVSMFLSLAEARVVGGELLRLAGGL